MKLKRIIFIILGLIILASGAASLPHIPIQNDIKNLIISSNDKTDPLYISENKFASQNDGLIILSIESEQKFSHYEDFSFLDTLKNALKLIPGIDSVSTVLDIKIPKRVNYSVFEKPLIKRDYGKISSMDLAWIKSYSDISSLYIDSAFTATNLFLFTNKSLDIEELLDFKASTIDSPNALHFYWVGNPIFEHEIKSKVDKDIFRLAAIGFAIILLLFILFFRSIRTAIFTGIMVSINVSGALLIMYCLNLEFNILTAVIPTVIAILSVTDLNHIIHVYYHEDHLNAPIRNTYNKLWFSLLLTSVTTLIGFSIFLINDIPQINDFGIIAILSITWALITSFTFAPNYLFILKPNTEKLLNTRPIEIWVIGLTRQRHKLVSLIFVVSLVTIGTFSITNWDINYSTYDDMDDDSPIRASYDFFNERFSGTKSLELIIKINNNPTSSENIQKISTIDSLLIAKYNYETTNSIATLTKNMNRFWNKGKQSYYNLNFSWDSTKLNELTSRNPNLVNSVISTHNQYLRITALGRELSAKESIQKYETLKKELDHLSDDNFYILPPTGISVVRDQSTQTISKTIMYGIFVSITVISIILGILYKSFITGIVAFFVNLFPILFSVGMLFLIGKSITPAIAMMLSISFGIALDDTVYFFTRLYKNKKEFTPEDITANVKQINFPVISTSIILSGSFCALFFSSFDFNVINALIIICSLLVAMICDLIFLPSLLRFFSSKKPQN